MQYVRLAEGLYKYKLIPAKDAIWDHIQNNDLDYYSSIYEYNDEQYEHWKKTASLAGITDVTTSKLIFDFDDAVNLENAKKDTLTTIDRLVEKGIPKDKIQISFSGSKGFGLQVDTDQTLTPDDFKSITRGISGDLKTFDTSVSDAQRIVRVVGTKHPKSKLYKIPLTLNQISSLNVDDIKSLAKNLDDKFVEVINSWSSTSLPESFKQLKQKKKEQSKMESQIIVTEGLDMSAKPKWLSEAKWALQNGFFGEGQRNGAFMILASTYRGQGFDKVVTYRMLKGVAEIQAKRNNVTPYDNSELWKNIINVVYSPSWKGGNYSYDNTPLLQEVTKNLGLRVPSIGEENPKFITDITGKFKHYVKNIEKNTIKTGIKSLDRGLFMSTGMNIGLLGAPGSGKSSLALEILRNTSKNGVKSVFASLDMSSTRIYEKLMYKLTGRSRDEVYKSFKEDKEEEYIKLLEENYGNVFFYDKSSPTVKDIREYILKCQEQSGEKIKLVMLDYFERLSSDINDDTAASKRVAGELQDLVNDLDICLITLVQPNKMSGDMSQPILSYNNIKGSSFLAQSFRMILSIYREGFTPIDSSQDRFLTVNVLKNDLGESGSYDFSWNGKRGEISDLDGSGKNDLDRLRKGKKESDDDDFGPVNKFY